MEILGKKICFGAWEITPTRDKYGKKQMQIRVYPKMANGFKNIAKYKEIYVKVEDWEDLKEEIIRRDKTK